MKDTFGSRLLWITLAAIVVAIVWQAVPGIRATLLSGDAEPRAVTARGELAADEAATIALFEAAKDSVVSIDTAERVVDYFTRNAFEVPRGVGSGFVWDDLGHIVTNHHVVEGASRASVRLADGSVLEARLVGSDPGNDLAVLRIDVGAGALPPIAIGTSQDLRVGQKAFAIGNPFGFDLTMTAGIVSALERELANGRGGTITGLVQTDAAINPGNSGGPLIDSAGRLIGVNTAIYSPSGGNDGIGFAVPVDTVNRIVPQLIARGRYAPPTIGISIDPRTDAILRQAGLSGVMVLGVEPGTAAERAGLRPARTGRDGGLVLGDVIVGLGGYTIETVSDLRNALENHDAGERVVLSVLREGTRERFDITLDAGA